MVELFDSPEKIISMLQNVEPYVIKIKCIACSETQFMPFQSLIVHENKVTIGCCSYPLHLIEYVVVKYKNDFENADAVKTVNFSDFRQLKDGFTATIPACSVVKFVIEK